MKKSALKLQLRAVTVHVFEPTADQLRKVAGGYTLWDSQNTKFTDIQGCCSCGGQL